MSFQQNTLATLSMIGKIGGAVSSAAGSYYTAQAQKSAAEFNARMAERSAQATLAMGQQQIAALTLKAGQLKGAQRAALAANGVDLGVGSAAEVQASTELMKEIDKNTIEANATRSAWGYRAEAAMQQAQADSISPFMSGASTLLGGAMTVAESWYRMTGNNRASPALGVNLGQYQL